jgi:hypothetical protein
MSARNPEELDALFTRAMNAGDIEDVMKLYEPQAALRRVPGSSLRNERDSAGVDRLHRHEADDGVDRQDAGPVGTSR